MKSINLKKIISSMLAVMMITTLAGNKVVSAEENTKVRPRVSVHDPSIAKDKDGTYYVFGSHIDAAKSTDLKNWTVFTNGYAKTDNVLFGDLSKNLAGSFAWAGENDSDSKGGFSVWAPTVFYNETYVNKDGSIGAYMMYYCTSSTYKRSAIGFAVSQNIEGPYEYVDTIMYSGFTKVDNYDTNSEKNTIYTNTNIDELMNDKKIEDGLNDKWFSSNGQYNTSYAPNAIDPELFYDSEGKLWMTYGSWSGGVYILEIDKNTGKVIYPGVDSNIDSLNFTDRYFGTRIFGGYGQSGEGADVVYDKDAGYYYMTVTYAGLTANGGYNMRLFRAENPQGPYLDAKGQNAALSGNVSNTDYGIKLISNYKFDCQDKALKAAGHNSILLDDNGERYLIHHQRFDNFGEYHEVRVHKLLLSEDGWLIVAPYEYTGEKESDTPYDLSKVTGNYQFINHGKSNAPTIEPTLNISLNEDYTISGDLNGTWERKDKNNVNLIIDGVTYKGVFLEQEDESNTVNRVMTFSAIGENNLSIWGSKVSSNDKETAEYVARYLNNIIPSEVRENIELPTTGAFGTTITWESSNSNLLGANGVVNRGEKDTNVILKATVKKGESTSTNEFTINVIGLLKEVGVEPSYRYEFESTLDKNVESTGLESDSGTLVGNANIVKDEERGNVIEIKSDKEVRKENYFKLPEETFNNVNAEDGYTVSMWINLNKSNPNYWEHSAIFEAKAEVDYPMTRLGANLLGRINSNGAWADTQVGSKQIESRKWNYVTFTVSGKGIVVYLDGYEVARDNKDVTASFKDNFLAKMTDVRVASGDIWNDKDLAEAKFDNIEVYKKALNESQVEALYYQELKVEEEKPVELIKPLYKYNFESINENEVANSGIKDESGILLGNSTVIKDEERGNVLEIKGEDKDGVNYFKLPENTFDGITEEGYTVSMWVNLDKAYENYNEHSALFDASNNQEFPMTRLGANLIGRINANEVWSDTFNVNKQLTSKKWEYVTFSVNKYGIAVYINGEEVAREDKDISKAFENNALSILKDVRIGSGSVWEDKDIAYAKFDNIAFYNRALSEKEVVVLYGEETKAEKPTDPDIPVTPEEPTDPEEPTNPDIPVIPEEPNTPETPEEPTDPEVPEIPEEPVNSELVEKVVDKIEDINGVTSIVIDEVKEKVSIEINDIAAIKEGTGSIKIENGSNIIELPFSLIDKDLLKDGTKIEFKMSISKDEAITSTIKALDKVFEFNLLVRDDDNVQQIHQFNDGVATIKLSLTDEELKDIDKEKITVFYYNEESKALEELESILEGNELTFKTNHFSKFIIGERNNQDEEKPTDPEIPEEPTNPEIPVTPEEPSNPETPEIPEEPVTPEEPTNPEIPVIPEKPNTPETPNISEDNNEEDNTEVIPGDVDNDTDKNQNNDSNNNINNESELPQTGGNNPAYLVLLSLIVVGIGSVLLLKRKNKKEA